jgi:hypothetical protein
VSIVRQQEKQEAAVRHHGQRALRPRQQPGHELAAARADLVVVLPALFLPELVLLGLYLQPDSLSWSAR